MGIKKYFRCRSIQGLIEETKKSKILVRSLSAFQLVMLGIGGIIGGGIFVFTGSAAARHAGPAISLSFILAGLACICVALCYAELASMIPVSGSAYTYAYASLGELPAWLIASMTLLTYGLGAAAVASGWSGYFQSLLLDYGIYFPARFSDSFGETVFLKNGTSVATLIDVPVLLIVTFVGFVVYRGAKTSAWVNTIIVTVKMLVLLMFIIFGFAKIDPNNWQPFIPKNSGIFGEFGWSGVIAGASVIFLAYTGFDAVATAAQEAKNPRRDLPIGIIGSLLTCIIVYTLVSAMLTGIVSYKELNVPEPIAVAVNKMGMPWFSICVKIGALAGLTTVILILIYGAVRIFYTVSTDGLLPKIFSKANEKTHIPSVLTIVIAVGVALMGALFPVHKLVRVANFATLITFSIVCFGTIYLRYTKPNIKREFKCPFVPIIPCIGIVLLFIIMGSFSQEIFIYIVIWTIFMLALYFMYGSKHSHLLNG